MNATALLSHPAAQGSHIEKKHKMNLSRMSSMSEAKLNPNDSSAVKCGRVSASGNEDDSIISLVDKTCILYECFMTMNEEL